MKTIEELQNLVGKTFMCRDEHGRGTIHRIVPERGQPLVGKITYSDGSSDPGEACWSVSGSFFGEGDGPSSFDLMLGSEVGNAAEEKAEAATQNIQNIAVLPPAYSPSRRDYFAAAALQGILQDVEKITDGWGSFAAEHAVICADKLIAELDKP